MLRRGGRLLEWRICIRWRHELCASALLQSPPPPQCTPHCRREAEGYGISSLLPSAAYSLCLSVCADGRIALKGTRFELSWNVGTRGSAVAERPSVSGTLHWRISRWIICSWTNAPLRYLPLQSMGQSSRFDRIINAPVPGLGSKYGSLEMTSCDRMIDGIWLHKFLFLFNSNYGSILHRFWQIWYSKIQNTATLKCGSGVTQDRWNWYYSVACQWFPINVL